MGECHENMHLQCVILGEILLGTLDRIRDELMTEGTLGTYQVASLETGRRQVVEYLITLYYKHKLAKVAVDIKPEPEWDGVGTETNSPSKSKGHGTRKRGRKSEPVRPGEPKTKVKKVQSESDKDQVTEVIDAAGLTYEVHEQDSDGNQSEIDHAEAFEDDSDTEPGEAYDDDPNDVNYDPFTSKTTLTKKSPKKQKGTNENQSPMRSILKTNVTNTPITNTENSATVKSSSLDDEESSDTTGSFLVKEEASKDMQGESSSSSPTGDKIIKNPPKISAKIEHKPNKALKKSVLCHICDSVFKTPSGLKFHIITVHEMKGQHMCGICDHVCASRSALQTHLQKHSGVKRFPCSWCQARFTYKTSLRQHSTVCRMLATCSTTQTEDADKVTNVASPVILRRVPLSPGAQTGSSVQCTQDPLNASTLNKNPTPSGFIKIVPSPAKSFVGTSNTLAGTSFVKIMPSPAKSFVGTSNTLAGTSFVKIMPSPAKPLVGTSNTLAGTSFVKIMPSQVKSLVGTSSTLAGTSPLQAGTSPSLLPVMLIPANVKPLEYIRNIQNTIIQNTVDIQSAQISNQQLNTHKKLPMIVPRALLSPSPMKKILIPVKKALETPEISVKSGVGVKFMCRVVGCSFSGASSEELAHHREVHEVRISPSSTHTASNSKQTKAAKKSLNDGNFIGTFQSFVKDKQNLQTTESFVDDCKFQTTESSQDDGNFCDFSSTEHEDKKKLHCDMCFQRFSNAGCLTLHMKVHKSQVVDDSNFKCPICAREFLMLEQFTGHMKFHSVHKPYTCTVPKCGRTFSYPNSLHRHAQVCTGGGGKSVCTECKAQFERKEALEEHMRELHGESGGNVCHCGKEFKWKGSYYIHVRACKVGLKAQVVARSKESMEKHTQVHPEKGGIVCKCGQTFTWKGPYNIHVRNCRFQ